MLIYHPAYDAYHCLFRLIKIIQISNKIEISKLRILDFYLVYPAEVAKISLPRDQVEIKKIAAKLKNTYHGPVNTFQAFRDMQHLQYAAISTLAASNILDGEKLSSGIIERTNTPLPDFFNYPEQMATSEENMIHIFILKTLSEMPLNGTNGLKQRTGLMEYRYDNA